LQEILLRAHRGFANLRAAEAVTTWLFRIATHACVDHFRQRARQPVLGQLHAIVALLAFPATAEGFGHEGSQLGQAALGGFAIPDGHETLSGARQGMPSSGTRTANVFVKLAPRS
jgi:hypothetical protein